MNIALGLPAFLDTYGHHLLTWKVFTCRTVWISAGGIGNLASDGQTGNKGNHPDTHEGRHLFRIFLRESLSSFLGSGSWPTSPAIPQPPHRNTELRHKFVTCTVEGSKLYLKEGRPCASSVLALHLRSRLPNLLPPLLPVTPPQDRCPSLGFGAH
jgi:hypothetical protein